MEKERFLSEEIKSSMVQNMSETDRKEEDEMPEVRRSENETETIGEKFARQTTRKLEEARERIKELEKKLGEHGDYDDLNQKIKVLEHQALLHDTKMTGDFVPLPDYEMYTIEPPTEIEYKKSMQWFILNKRYAILAFILIFATLLLGLLAGWIGL